MKHCELLKLVPGADPVEIQEKLWKGLRKLDDELDWVNHPLIHRACKPGDDYDLMTVVEIDAEERLDEYLSHPLSVKLAGKVADAVQSKAAFNHY